MHERESRSKNSYMMCTLCCVIAQDERFEQHSYAKFFPVFKLKLLVVVEWVWLFQTEIPPQRKRWFLQELSMFNDGNCDVTLFSLLRWDFYLGHVWWDNIKHLSNANTHSQTNLAQHCNIFWSMVQANEEKKKKRRKTWPTSDVTANTAKISSSVAVANISVVRSKFDFHSRMTVRYIRKGKNTYEPHCG